MTQSVPILNSICGFLLFYTMFIAYLFRSDLRGQRNWRGLDYVWVPLGGLAGFCLILVLWRSAGHPAH